MEENEKRICRLCLKLFRNDFQDYQAMEEVTREIFDVLLLKINCSISKDPVLCTNCAENLKKFFEFKSTCLYTEDRLVPLNNAINSNKVDLLDVAYMNANRNKNNEQNVNNAICRFCMQRMEKDSCIALDTLEEDFGKEIVHKCIPEMDLTITRKPVICNSCMEFLMGYHNFMTSCLEVEKNISDYCRFQGIDKGREVNLENVYFFVVRNTLIRDEPRNLVEVKTEPSDIGIELVSDFTIKNEEIDIDLEQEPPETERTETVSTQNKKPPTNRKFKCAKCTYTTPHKHRLQRHLISHKSLSEIKTFNCDKCSRKFKYRDGLRCHMSRTHPDNEAMLYKCDKCSYSSLIKSDLKSHMLRHANASETDYFRCAKCSYATPRKSGLRQHVLTHMNPSKLAKFKCEYCTYSTYKRHRLVKHNAIHERDSEGFRCDLCAYTTFLKDDLKRHILADRHSNVAQAVFKCNWCQYEATRERYLVSHMNLHKDRLETVENYFKCDKCSFEAKSEDHLRKHSITRHKSRWQSSRSESEAILYKCYSCSFHTKHKASLRYHIVFKHKSQGIDMTLFQPSSTDVKLEVPLS